MLVKIPSNLENSKSVWYVVAPSTKEQFFDESAPDGVSNMNGLISAITDGRKDEDLIPVVVFNSTPRAGEARHELRRLTAEKLFEQTRISSTVSELLEKVK